MGEVHQLELPVDKAQEQAFLLTPEAIEMTWGALRGFLLKGEEYWADHFALSDLLRGLLCCELFAWGFVQDREMKSLMLVQFQTMPKMRVARIVYLGGEDIKLMLRLFDKIEEWAAELGATRIEIVGREPWERVFREHYEKSCVVLVRDLKPSGPTAA